MKKLSLAYYEYYPETPVTTWVRSFFIVKEQKTSSGQRKKSTRETNPYFLSRKLWCELTVELDRVVLYFATPEELDHVRDVLGQKVIPSGHSLFPDAPSWMRLKGRPKHHWLALIPAKAKSWKFRQRFLNATRKDVSEIREFRKFYQTGWAMPSTVSAGGSEHASV